MPDSAAVVTAMFRSNSRKASDPTTESAVAAGDDPQAMAHARRIKRSASKELAAARHRDDGGQKQERTNAGGHHQGVPIRRSRRYGPAGFPPGR